MGRSPTRHYWRPPSDLGAWRQRRSSNTLRQRRPVQRSSAPRRTRGNASRRGGAPAPATCQRRRSSGLVKRQIGTGGRRSDPRDVSTGWGEEQGAVVGATRSGRRGVEEGGRGAVAYRNEWRGSREEKFGKIRVCRVAPGCILYRECTHPCCN
jgi:hypothetical protein